MDEKDPRVVDALNHLLITAIEKRWSTLLFEAGPAPVPLEASGPWEDETLAGEEPEKARAMIERLAVLAKFPKGSVTGRGAFALKWGKVTAQIAVDIEETTESGLRAFLEFLR